MNRAHRMVNRIKIGLGLAVLAGLTGCVGYVGGGGYGGAVVEPGPDVFFGGVYERGGDVRGYSHRGVESRAVAHGGGGARGGRR